MHRMPAPSLIARSLRTLRPRLPPTHIPSSHAVSDLGSSALDTWTETALLTPYAQTDTISLTPSLLLHHTLPTRSGPIYTTPTPLPSSPLPQGHHLTLFPPLYPESQLNPDGTEPSFSPPPPWTRRMWAAGSMAWEAGNELRIGEEVTCESVVESVEKKGWDGERPKVFVWQRREISNARGLALTERRAHVYQPPADPSAPPNPPSPRPSTEMPDPDFSIRFTPTLLTLFRFSALTFNAHRIHYDPFYPSPSPSESAPSSLLVHAPLTALLLIDLVNFNLPPQARIASFSYRAVRPLAVGEEVTFKGAWKEGVRGVVSVWAEDKSGEVAVVGEAAVDGLLG